MKEIPNYCLRAYALFFSKHGLNEEFSQTELDWIVSQSMKKKIFSILLNSGWIEKASGFTYRCVEPKKIFIGLLEFKVPEIIKEARKKYAFTGLSAIEIWSDYSYIQRGREKSPYYIKILRKDISYWKSFFNKNKIPNYVKSGSTIGEHVIFIPVDNIDAVEKNGMFVEKLNRIIKTAKKNILYEYPYNYIKKKYGTITA